ncbi:hypothetical protein LTR84_003661 [Exophiala bonariae]|uniref:Elongation factor 1 alpha-like protein n=1 Tax=Exophiala bonariae TaxID=1690606 RepID=A0AAV9N5W3_9EURO|nr:hypothetical protein LTR84_003661 [Exophiala bonariae]
MSNRRVKAMALEDDDYDDYDDYSAEDDSNTAAEEISAEDKQKLQQYTPKVRQALGPNFPATDSDIQDALWYYFYDISKSVSWLKNKQPPVTSEATQKSKASKSKSHSSVIMLLVLPFQSCLHHCGHGDLRNGPFEYASDEHEEVAESVICSSPFSAAEFFKDSPWLKIPQHRKAEITMQPLYPRGGLLGGTSKASKPSKLAALAAKRKQQVNEQPGSIATNTVTRPDDYTAHLNKLRISKSPQAAIQLENQEDQKQPSDVDMLRYEESKSSETDKVRNDHSSVVDRDIRGQPSLFASIMTSQTADKDSRSSSEFVSNALLSRSFDFTEPSPDDIVTRAQNVKAPAPTKTKPKESTKTSSSIAKGVQNLSIQEPPKVKSKNLDVVAEFQKVKRKKAANFVVIGHVDAGKSTLMGRLLFDLKAVDQRTMQKYQQEADRIGKGSFAFAWVLDQGTEERARGVTIDIATNNFETEKTSFTILDAPGHRDFVPNMIAGASQADFAVLVIDASPSNFESGLRGQTKEHALLARSIGVQRIIVAVNKMDSADWSEERFREIQQQLAAFLNTAGFQAKNVTFVPCSGLAGGNILSKPSDPRASWYTGPSLVEELDTSEPSTYALDKSLRMTISDVFRGGVQNPLSVSGRLEAGNVQIGEQVVIMPSGEKAQIRSLEVDEEPRDWAVAGQNVVLNLTDVDPIHLKTGDVLCSPNSPIKNISDFKAKILAFDHLTPMNLDVHKGRLHIPGKITQLIATLDKSTGAVLKKKPKIVQPGSVVRVVVQLDQAVPLEAPARIVLRANGETVAAGLIE